MLALLLALTPLALADFSGTGHITIWNSSDWRTASPSQAVGCLSATGRFIAASPPTPACALFTRRPTYPYTLSTSAGNCTWADATQEHNTDSIYGSQDAALHCLAPFESSINDDVYTIDGFPYTFLCTGDTDCYFDAKRVPGRGEDVSVWPYAWGSQQLGITPGHVMLQMVWNQVGGAAVGKKGVVVDLEGGEELKGEERVE